MVPQIFMTGATSFAGGAMLHTLTANFSDCLITALVRTSAQASTLHQEYPTIETVVGTLESRDVLLAEAAKADIVLHASNADHEAGIFSLLDGLKSKCSTDKGTFIHVSGAASLINLTELVPGQAGKVYSDIDNADEIFQLPKNRLHVAIERRLMKESEASGIKSVILAPPMIFPSGTGICRQDSYGNLYARAIMQTGYPFVIGEGKNMSCWVSSDDLAEVVSFVIKEALKGSQSRLGYGRDGFYFCEAGELEVFEQARRTAKELKRLGAVKTSSVVSISPQRSRELNEWAVLLWGTGMRTRGDKLRALGWKPKTEDWVPFVRNMAKAEFGEKIAAMQGVV